jgi:hypothetical protein
MPLGWTRKELQTGPRRQLRSDRERLLGQSFDSGRLLGSRLARPRERTGTTGGRHGQQLSGEVRDGDQVVPSGVVTRPQ